MIPGSSLAFSPETINGPIGGCSERAVYQGFCGGQGGVEPPTFRFSVVVWACCRLLQRGDSWVAVPVDLQAL